MEERESTAAKDIGAKLLRQAGELPADEGFRFLVGTCVRLSALPMLLINPDGYSDYRKMYLKCVNKMIDDYLKFDKTNNQH